MAEWETRLTRWKPIAFRRRMHPWVAGGIVNGFADGVVESETAMMLAPYQGKTAGSPGALGRPQWEPGELAEADIRREDRRAGLAWLGLGVDRPGGGTPSTRKVVPSSEVKRP